jgi:hypothetical protein
MRLKADYQHRGEMLKADSKTYIKQFSVGKIIKNAIMPSGFQKLDESTNITSKVMAVVLPLLLNSTIFRGSGIVTKAISALVSGKIGNSIDAENLTGIFNKVKFFFNKKDKKKEVAFIDYGIPPDSETY